MGHGVIRLLGPSPDGPLEIQVVAGEIESPSSQNLDAPIRQIMFEFGDAFAQGIPRFFLGQRFRHHPKAEFAAFQAGLEIGHECIEQIFFGLVKHEEVTAPRHIPHHANSGLSQLRINGLRRHGQSPLG